MHVLSKPPLARFWVLHPRARNPLEAWLRCARKATWASFAAVRADYPAADQYGRFVIFDIGGNKYRLIVHIHYNRRKVYVHRVLTHADYTRGDWKTE